MVAVLWSILRLSFRGNQSRSSNLSCSQGFTKAHLYAEAQHIVVGSPAAGEEKVLVWALLGRIYAGCWI
jgi:hypothetical protein